jgi:hypothetical protein
MKLKKFWQRLSVMVSMASTTINKGNSLCSHGSKICLANPPQKLLAALKLQKPLAAHRVVVGACDVGVSSTNKRVLATEKKTVVPSTTRTYPSRSIDSSRVSSSSSASSLRSSSDDDYTTNASLLAASIVAASAIDTPSSSSYDYSSSSSSSSSCDYSSSSSYSSDYSSSSSCDYSSSSSSFDSSSSW